MLLTGHYYERPFDETVCGAIISNGGVKNPSKKVQNVCDGGTKETGSQMKVCAIYNIRFTRTNCFWLGNTKETVSQIKVCAIYSMRFTQMNCLLWAKRTETVQYNKICVIRGKQVYNQKCVRRLIITQTISANKPCVLWASAWWYTIVSDWWNHHRRVPQYGPCAMSLHREQHHMYL